MISGTADAARQILTTPAAAVITVVGVVFSIVTLTLASTRFGPRIRSGSTAGARRTIPSQRRTTLRDRAARGRGAGDRAALTGTLRVAPVPDHDELEERHPPRASWTSSIVLR
ncbi:DUF2254 family protein [Streptomyces sp. NPDC056638]|uniref:DUF2254 family protein n=1 Tax=Streptomyces sp. NPDC056638 TaxID=3345887 RepID=UPI00368EE2DC